MVEIEQGAFAERLLALIVGRGKGGHPADLRYQMVGHNLGVQPIEGSAGGRDITEPLRSTCDSEQLFLRRSLRVSHKRSVQPKTAGINTR
ncbi:hypothetical protein ACCS68_33935 [Rhizobium beringeri]|uniref:hypothetical protein n=1 Tax=Rhizobium TaxID=379 RepID=UPI001030678A|nr:hypothetical protein [Rhizobium leguminosarum]TAW53245.1 hypothetical protein ELI14_19045 [Rhizobium leguminosarum]